MAFDKALYEYLKSDLGMDEAQSRAAAGKFQAGERGAAQAVEWIYSAEGQAAAASAASQFVIPRSGPSSTNASPPTSPRLSPAPGFGHSFTSGPTAKVNVVGGPEAISNAWDVSQQTSAGRARFQDGERRSGSPLKNESEHVLKDLTYAQQLEMAMKASVADNGGSGAGTPSAGGPPPPPTAPPLPPRATAFASNNPFAGSESSSSTTLPHPPAAKRPPPILATKPTPISNDPQGSTSKNVTFGKVEDETMDVDMSKAMVRVVSVNADDEKETEEDVVRRGRSPTPAKRARLKSPAPPDASMSGGDAELERIMALSMETYQHEEKQRTARENDVGMGTAQSASGYATPMDVEESDKDDELKAVGFDEDDEITEVVPDRPEGIPMMFFSATDNSIYAAHIITLLSAVPQFANVLKFLPLNNELQKAPDAARRLAWIRDLYEHSRSSQKPFKNIAKPLFILFKNVVQGTDNMATEAHKFLTSIIEDWVGTAAAVKSISGEDDLISLDDERSAEQREYARYLEHPTSLFCSYASTEQDRLDKDDLKANILSVVHHPDICKDVLGCLSQTVWDHDGTIGIESLADVFALTMIKGARNFGSGTTELVQLNEFLYMDRWLAKNRKLVAQTRASEGLIRGQITKTSEEIKELRFPKGKSIEDSFRIGLAHFESPNAPNGDDAAKKKTLDTIEGLKRLQATHMAKIEEKETHLKNLQEELPKIWAVPELQKHKFLLRGVLIYGGFVSQASFIVYWRDGDGQWFKGQNAMAEKTTFEAVCSDNLGLYFDAGAYLLIYSREGPRPPESEMPLPPVGVAEAQAGPSGAQASSGPTDLLSSVQADDASNLQGPMLQPSTSNKGGQEQQWVEYVLGPGMPMIDRTSEAPVSAASPGQSDATAAQMQGLTVDVDEKAQGQGQ